MKNYSRNKKRKAFTIVELVIVIAVIAILAGVMIPTFGNVVQTAKDSRAMQEARQAYIDHLTENNGETVEKALYEADDGRWVALHNGAAVGVYETPEDAMKAMIANPDMSKLTTTNKGKLFIYGAVHAPGGNGGDASEDSNSDDSTDWSGASAVFVGDSITAAGELTEKFYYEHLKEILNLSSVSKQATSGSCISITSDYKDKNSPLIGRYQDIPDGDLIVIFMGTNDFGHATPLGSIADTSDVSFYGALNVIIPDIQTAHPNSQIVMITPMHRTTTQSTGMDAPNDYTPNKANATLENYVNAIKDICNKYGLYIIDLFSESELNPNNEMVKNTYFHADGLHPNTAGHEKIAEILGVELHKIPRKEVNTDTPETPEYTPDYTLQIGNKFGGESFATTPTRACTVKNIYLKAGTIVTIKDNATYDWAVSPETSENSINDNGQYLTQGWDTGAYCVIPSDGWYGFTLAKNTYFNFDGSDSNKLLDYFDIIEQVKMTNDNRFAPNASIASTRLSAVINLYLPAGTFITFKTGTPATHWAISKTTTAASAEQNYKTDYLGSAWTPQTTFTVTEEGYYGFVLKNDSTALSSADCDLFDFFVISGYND